MACVDYSSGICSKCEVLSLFLQEHSIEHSVRMIEGPDVRVDALMLEIYSTPALVIGENVLHQSDMFQDGHLDVDTLLTFIRSNSHGKA